MKFLFGSPTLKAYLFLCCISKAIIMMTWFSKTSQTPAFEHQKLVFNAFTMPVKLAVRAVSKKEWDLFDVSALLLHEIV